MSTKKRAHISFKIKMSLIQTPPPPGWARPTFWEPLAWTLRPWVRIPLRHECLSSSIYHHHSPVTLSSTLYSLVTEKASQNKLATSINSTDNDNWIWIFVRYGSRQTCWSAISVMKQARDVEAAARANHTHPYEWTKFKNQMEHLPRSRNNVHELAVVCELKFVCKPCL
jgi:hypothetical protein